MVFKQSPGDKQNGDDKERSLRHRGVAVVRRYIIQVYIVLLFLFSIIFAKT